MIERIFTSHFALDFVVGCELDDSIDDVLLDATVLQERRHQVRDVGDAKNVDAIVTQNLSPSLFPVQKYDGTVDLK
jgi:hypothetical protein